MAVPEQTPYIEHTGNGITTSFALGFQCETKDHLIVLVDDVEPPIATWSLNSGNVVFTTAPAAGKKIALKRNTPLSRTTNYQGNNNSFRPETINKDIDKVWLKLQELGVADWLLKLYVDRLHQQQEQKINNLKTYVDDKDDELRAYLLEEIRKQGVALDQLDDYYNYLMQRLAQIAVDKGWEASFVVDASGKTQQEINNGLSTSSLKAIQNPVSLYYYNKDKQGYFEWRVGNFSTMVALDKQEGIYVASNLNPTGSLGVWRRVFSGKPYAKWFGVLNDDTNLQDAVNVCKYFGGIIFESDASLTLTKATDFDGLNNFTIEGNGAKIAGTVAKPFSVKNSVKFKASGFDHTYTGLADYNSVLFDPENCNDIKVFDNVTNASSIARPKNCKTVHIYKNNCDMVGLENQHLQMQGCNHVYVYLNVFKNSRIDAIKITGDVNNHIYIYRNDFENLGGYSSQGDCVDCYSGGVNVYIFNNTAINCRQLANLKKGDLPTGDAPTSKIQVYKNICINCWNLAQLWNVDHCTVSENRFIHDGYTGAPATSLVNIQYSTTNCTVEKNEFINVTSTQSVIHVSGAPNNLKLKDNSIISSGSIGITYADIYLAITGGSVEISGLNTNHPDTVPSIRVNPPSGSSAISLWVNLCELHSGIRLDADINPESFININENKIPSSVSRPIHNAITGDLPILNISDNSWQGHKRGSTLQRPVLPSSSADAALYLGQSYFDTTVGKPVFVKNTNPMQWVDATGTIV